jgi:glutathione S-transferase
MNYLYATMGSGNCFKAFLAMEQLNIPFRVVPVDVLKGENRKLEYLAINPNGTVPYLVLADGRGIGESNAMLWYLAEGSYLIPADPYLRAKVLQWMFFEQTSLEPFISPARFFTSILPGGREGREKEIAAWQERGRKGLKLFDEHLRGCRFLVDDRYTIADISAYGYTHVAEEGGFELADYPAVRDWIARVEETGGYVPLGSLLNPSAPALQTSAAGAA